MKKTRLLVLSLLFTAAIAVSSILVFSNAEKLTNLANSTSVTYTMTLDENNRFVRTKDSGSFYEGTTTTDLGNVVEYSYSANLDNTQPGEFTRFLGNLGDHFNNTTPINGLYRIDYSIHNKITFDYGYSPVYAETYHHMDIGAGKDTSGTIYLDLSEGYPSYFSFTSYSVARIYSLKLYYTCVASPDPHRQEGHWEYDLANDSVTLKGFHIGTDQIPEDGILHVPGSIGAYPVDHINLNTLNNISWVKHIILPFVGQSRYLDEDGYSHSFGSIFGSQSGNIYYHPVQQNDAAYYIPNSLKTITINGGNKLVKDGEVAIPDYGFYGLDIPNIIINGPHHKEEGLDGKISNIGRFAFANCQNLKELYLPYSITTIGDNAFAADPGLIIRCYGDVEITDAMNPNYAKVTNRYLNTYSYNGITYDLYEIDDVGSVANVIGIEDRNITTIHFEDKVTFDGVEYDVKSVANRAFEDCSQLSRVFFPAGMEKVGHYAFKSAYRATFFIGEAITSAYLSDWNKDSGNYYDSYGGTIRKRDDINYFVLSDNTTYIVDSAEDETVSEYSFDDTDAEKICFPSYFMEGNEYITTINLPAVVAFDRGSFINCKNLEVVNYAGSKFEWPLQIRGNNVFAGTKVTVIHCSDGDINL